MQAPHQRRGTARFVPSPTALPRRSVSHVTGHASMTCRTQRTPTVTLERPRLMIPAPPRRPALHQCVPRTQPQRTPPRAAGGRALRARTKTMRRQQLAPCAATTMLEARPPHQRRRRHQYPATALAGPLARRFVQVVTGTTPVRGERHRQQQQQRPRLVDAPHALSLHSLRRHAPPVPTTTRPRGPGCQPQHPHRPQAQPYHTRQGGEAVVASRVDLLARLRGGHRWQRRLAGRSTWQLERGTWNRRQCLCGGAPLVRGVAKSARSTTPPLRWRVVCVGSQRPSVAERLKRSLVT